MALIKIILFLIIINIFPSLSQNWWNFENIENPNRYPPFTPMPEIRFTHTTIQGEYDQDPNDVIVNIPQAGFGTFVGFSQWVNYDYTWTSWPPQIGRLVNVFLGIPYAAPPTSDYRFKRPIPAYLDARYIWFAKKYKSACMQNPKIMQKTMPNLTDFSEDCLYLNIFYPNQTWDSPTTTYPVVVHIHGGSFVYGSSHLYPGHSLASTGVVVVTFNYRLGPFGFLSTGDFASIGNYGLWDQVLALEWVRDNIHWFRGDSSRITLMGESAGAASVGLHLVSPISRDRNLYHQAIIMSGSDMSSWAIADPDNVKTRLYADLLAEKLGCKNSDIYRQILCLRYYKDAENIVKIAISIEAPNGAPEQTWSPVVDGTAGFMPRHPRIERSQGRYTMLPVLCGIVHNEGSWVAVQNLKAINKSITDNLTGYDIKQMINQFIKTVNVFRINDTLEELQLRYTWWSNLANVSARTEELSDLYSDYYIKSPLYETLLYQANGSDHTYFYEWAYRGMNDTNPLEMGIYHGVDTGFVFGFPFMNKSFVKMLYGPNFYYGALNQTWNYPYDTNMSEFAMHLWSYFIKMGNPTPWEFRNFTWVPFTPTLQSYAHLYINSSNHKNYRQSHLSFWRTKFLYLAEPLPAMDISRIFPIYEEQIATIILSFLVLIVLIAIIFVVVYLCRRPHPDKFKTKVRIRDGDKFTSAFQDNFSGYPSSATKSLL